MQRRRTVHQAAELVLLVWRLLGSLQVSCCCRLFASSSSWSEALLQVETCLLTVFSSSNGTSTVIRFYISQMIQDFVRSVFANISTESREEQNK
jgi:hypothetical protein